MPEVKQVPMSLEVAAKAAADSFTKTVERAPAGAVTDQDRADAAELLDAMKLDLPYLDRDHMLILLQTMTNGYSALIDPEIHLGPIATGILTDTATLFILAGYQMANDNG